MKNSYIVYGAGEVGVNAAKSLIENRHYVVCFIDANASGLDSQTGLPILRLDSDEVQNLNRESVVVIALADGIAHKEVAENLFSLGFDHISMLPMDLPISPEEEVAIVREYNAMLRGAPAAEKPSFCRICRPALDCHFSLIEEIDGCDDVIVWTSPEILFSEREDLWRGDLTKLTTKHINMDVNISAYNAYMELYAYLDGKLDDCPSLWDSFFDMPDENEKLKEIRKREKLVRVYNRYLSRGLDFFVAGAPLTIWNNNRWNLHGGHHREAYLVYRGIRRLPIRVGRNDFEIWCNESRLDDIRKYMTAHRIVKTKTPIPHPAFINIPAERETGGECILDEVYRFLRRNNTKLSSALDVSDLTGYLARAVARTAENECVYVSADNTERGFADELNSLLYADNVRCVDVISSDRVYDGVFAVSLRLNNYEEIYNCVCHLIDCVGRYLFIEVPWAVHDRIEELCYSFSFLECELIHREIVEARMYATYVFTLGVS